jgi:predicted MFS family arabinose efflux permease
LGTLVTLLVGPAMSVAWGWRSVWWLGAGVALLALALVWLLIRTPPRVTEETAVEQTPPMRQALANRDIWLLALAFACFNLALVSMMTYYPTYLATQRGYSLANASLVLSTVMFVILVASPLVGILLDKFGAHKAIMIGGFGVLMVMMLFPFTLSGGAITVWMVLLGLIGGSLPVACFSAVPGIMRKPQLAGIGMAVMMIGQNVGQLIGAPLFGALAESAGWAAAGYGMIPALTLGLAASWLVKTR